jgi:hypothetical protein
MRRLKLIWDFKGPDAAQTAAHHLVHLNDYAQGEQLEVIATGVEAISETHHIAFMALDESIMLPVRDALKPHRGQLWES